MDDYKNWNLKRGKFLSLLYFNQFDLEIPFWKTISQRCNWDVCKIKNQEYGLKELYDRKLSSTQKPQGTIRNHHIMFSFLIAPCTAGSILQFMSSCESSQVVPSSCRILFIRVSHLLFNIFLYECSLSLT